MGAHACEYRKNMKPVTPEMVRQRRLHSRNGNALACSACGKAIVPKPGSRRQKYCRDACKMIPDPLRSVENSARKSIPCKADFGGRAFSTKGPLNLIGGYSWPDATSVDPKLITKIMSTEIGSLPRARFPMDRS